jgi:hypothetical protein
MMLHDFVWSGIDIDLFARVVATGLIGFGAYWLTIAVLTQLARKK